MVYLPFPLPELSRSFLFLGVNYPASFSFVFPTCLFALVGFDFRAGFCMFFESGEFIVAASLYPNIKRARRFFKKSYVKIIYKIVGGRLLLYFCIMFISLIYSGC